MAAPHAASRLVPGIGARRAFVTLDWFPRVLHHMMKCKAVLSFCVNFLHWVKDFAEMTVPISIINTGPQLWFSGSGPEVPPQSLQSQRGNVLIL